MAKRGTETWLALGVVAIGLVIVTILGLLAYVMATPPLHPDAGAIPSATQSAASSRWTAAVEQGRQIVRTSLAEQSLPGLSVAIGVDGELVWAEAFGWADLETRVPVTPDTKFPIGTVSKTLTSAAVGLLVEDGRLNLDDEIQTYVPELEKGEWPVTLRQLMGHLAGVADDSGDEGPLFSRRCERPVEALQFLRGRGLEPRFEPGTRYDYSSYGWILVSAAVEAAADEPFLSFIEQRIFDPLGMHDTVPDSAAEPVPDRATSYFPRFAADPRYGLHLMRPLDFSCYAGASVFLSTPSDLVRFAMAINGGQLLQPETVQMLQTSLRLVSGEATGYGLGWDVETVTLAGQQTRAAGHDGEVLGGRAASLLTFPERGMAVAVISNISYADTSAVALKVAQAFAAPGTSEARP